MMGNILQAAVLFGLVVGFQGEAEARTRSAFTLTPTHMQSSENPWATMAQMDLQAIRDILAENHPGPVDPQNSAYREWMERGFDLATDRASGANSYADYVRSLRFYTNGFRDGHISVFFNLNPNQLTWPGFLVNGVGGSARVATVAEGIEVPLGAQLLACDGKSVDALLAERLDPFFWNRDIPHARWQSLPRLFVLQTSDTKLRLRSCTFAVDGSEPQSVDLHWVNAPSATVNEHYSRLAWRGSEPLLRRVEDVWFLTLPTFAYQGEGAARMRSIIKELEDKAGELRAGKLVLDVRGNGGGNSEWADRVVAALWGKELHERVRSSFDWTVDWRVSRANIEKFRSNGTQAERNGDLDEAEQWRGAADAMQAAANRGEQYLRWTIPPQSFEGPVPKNPNSGKIYLLTDNACGSACLDFADLVRRLPGATHVGLPTNADAIYIDNTTAALPSGLGGLSYSMKVYRNRVRGHNQWYDPEVLWPGGEMTDQALIVWLRTLD